MLSTNEMQKILKRFPKIELSYGKMIHKKVQTDLYQAIPYGKKYFAWFTWYKNENVCIFLETNYNLNIYDIFIRPVCFNHELSYNTILFGTFLPNQKFFVAEDIFYYKNKNISTFNFAEKLQYLSILFNNDIKQVSYSNTDTIISIPITSTSYSNLINEIRTLPYKIYSISCLNYTQSKTKYILKYKENPTYTATFIIKPDIQNDIYNLYYIHDSKEIFYNIAYIPDYTTSTMMNSLFRNIQENICLDALEESEDEDEFQNTSLDKYVDLDKSFHMECTFNSKFKMWVPKKITKTSSLVTKTQLSKYEKI